MENVLETNGVPLTVFGGAVPELAPEDLPEGASPFNQDVDYNPGSVFTRGGRANQIVLGNAFVEHLTGAGASIPGAAAPNEVVWSNPSNITLNTPGTYAFADVNHTGGGSGPGLIYVDAAISNAVNALTLPLSFVTSTQDFGLLIGATSAVHPQTISAVPPAGWSTLAYFTTGATNIAYSGVSAPGTLTGTINATFTTGGASNVIGGLMAAFPVQGTPVIALATSSASGGISSPFVLNQSTAIPAGCTLFFVCQNCGGAVSGAVTSVTDNKNPAGSWFKVTDVTFNNGTGLVFVSLWMCPNSVGVAGGGGYQATVVSAGLGDAIIAVISVTNLIALNTQTRTQILQAKNFAFSL
jgi:hypothetical protein